MGVRREVYNALGGFSEMRFGEDIDFSTRIFKGGYACRLFPEAWVWHKRRTDLKKFFKQVHNSGIARINLTKRHPGTLKLVHLLPAVFTLGVIFLLLAFIVGLALIGANLFAILASATGGTSVSMLWVGTFLGVMISICALTPLILYSLLIFVDSLRQNRSAKVAALSIQASFVQLTGYGTGFLRAWWERCVLGRGEFEAFKKNFYK
jgi:cellulose synthase/poly-beta-1,6-N-acetylglucosamine synthase-like glycosyltransferase